MAHARRCKASARRQIQGSGITCRFSGPAAPAAERPAVMQIEGLLKLLPLTSPVISVLALLVAVLSYRRSGRKEAGEAHAATLDAALDLEMILEVLYSNLLTLDLEGYREEVADVVARACEALPKLIASTEAIRERVAELQGTGQLNAIRTRLQTQRSGARTLVAMVAHGLERGKSA